ncbi:hypothetical protein C8R47DRAFT_1228785 [Mycena vitilis]|nr:hypothetical protein C8R47DRAFT_1228785 [Mycena vitilis]
MANSQERRFAAYITNGNCGSLLVRVGSTSGSSIPILAAQSPVVVAGQCLSLFDLAPDCLLLPTFSVETMLTQQDVKAIQTIVSNAVFSHVLTDDITVALTEDEIQRLRPTDMVVVNNIVRLHLPMAKTGADQKQAFLARHPTPNLNAIRAGGLVRWTSKIAPSLKDMESMRAWKGVTSEIAPSSKDMEFTWKDVKVSGTQRICLRWGFLRVWTSGYSVFGAYLDEFTRSNDHPRVPLAALLRRLHQLAFKAGGAEVKRYDVEVKLQQSLRVPLAALLRRLHQLAFKAGGAEVKRYDVEVKLQRSLRVPLAALLRRLHQLAFKAGGAEVKRYDVEVKLQRSLRVPLAAPLRRLHQLAFKAGGAEVKRYDVESSNGRPDSRWPYRSSASHFDASRSLNAILSLDSGTALPQHLSLRCVVRGHRIRVPGGQCGTPDRMLVRMKEHQLVLDAVWFSLGACPLFSLSTTPRPLPFFPADGLRIFVPIPCFSVPFFPLPHRRTPTLASFPRLLAHLADTDLITTLVDVLICAVLYLRLRRSCAFATSSRPYVPRCRTLPGSRAHGAAPRHSETIALFCRDEFRGMECVSDVVNSTHLAKTYLKYDLYEREPGILRRLPHLCCDDETVFDLGGYDIDTEPFEPLQRLSDQYKGAKALSQTLTKRREDRSHPGPV